jgi:hypothetical protein
MQAGNVTTKVAILIGLPEIGKGKKSSKFKKKKKEKKKKKMLKERRSECPNYTFIFWPYGWVRSVDMFMMV